MDDRNEGAESSDQDPSDSGHYGFLPDWLNPTVIKQRYAAKFAISMVLVVILIAAVGGMSYLQTRWLVQENAAEDLQSSAALQADVAAEWHGGTATKTLAFSRADVFAEGRVVDKRQYLQNLAEASSSDVTDIHYVRMNGTAQRVVASTDDSVEGRTVGTLQPGWGGVLALARQIGSTDTVEHSRASYAGPTGALMAFASPVSGTEGVLIVEARPPMHRLEQHSDRSTHVVSTDGSAVFRTDGSVPDTYLENTAFERAVGGERTMTETDDAFVAYASVGGTDWVAVTAAAKSSVLQASTVVGRNVVLLVGTTVLALGAVALVLGRQTVRPLVDLRERTQQMEAGDLSVELASDREDEIGRLYEAFRNMRDALREQIREAHTAREKAERSREELERQNRRLDQFASTLSHDLRNPLAVARGHVQLLDTKTGDEADEHVTKLEQSHDRIESIIDDVLTLAREGESIEDPERFSLRDAVEEAWENIDNKDATLEVRDDRTVEAERSRLLRALENLLRNSIDHVGEDVSVTVGLTDGGFYVADDGPGIPVKEVDDVFEYGHTTSEDGTGLGLSIVKTIAEAHGWRLYVDSTYEDGAMFVFDDVVDEDRADFRDTAFEWGGVDD